jgi:hypothetical protein
VGEKISFWNEQKFQRPKITLSPKKTQKRISEFLQALKFTFLSIFNLYLQGFLFTPPPQ